METNLELLNAARRLDNDVLVKIFDQFASPLYNYALHLCADPLRADQIVGDVFAKLLNQFASGNGPKSNLRAYLYETTYHMIVDEARYSRRRAPLEELDSVRQDVHSGWLSLEDQSMFQMILDAIQEYLTDNQRHVVILRFLEGFKQRETAAIMGITVAHVQVIQTRAIAKLRGVFASNESKTASSRSKVRKPSKVWLRQSGITSSHPPAGNASR